MRQVTILTEADDDPDDELRPEYDFDYSQAQPNHFAKQNQPAKQNGSATIVLEPDVAAVFTTSEQVNAALRALLQAIPAPALRERVEAA